MSSIQSTSFVLIESEDRKLSWRTDQKEKIQVILNSANNRVLLPIFSTLVEKVSLVAASSLVLLALAFYSTIAPVLKVAMLFEWSAFVYRTAKYRWGFEHPLVSVLAKGDPVSNQLSKEFIVKVKHVKREEGKDFWKEEVLTKRVSLTTRAFFDPTCKKEFRGSSAKA